MKNFNLRPYKVNYDANKNAWMTAELFKKWLMEFDASLERDTLLILDIVSYHVQPNIYLRHVKLIFLPLNCTLIAQPLGQGIIKSFKAKYREYALEFITLNEALYLTENIVLASPNDLNVKKPLK